MLCEIPASSYKPAHLVSISLASDVFMGFSKSANRWCKEFVGFHCTCSYTLLWLISAMLLSCYTLLIKYYNVCTNFQGLHRKADLSPSVFSILQSSTRWRFSSVHLCSVTWRGGRVRRKKKKSAAGLVLPFCTRKLSTS